MNYILFYECDCFVFSAQYMYDVKIGYFRNTLAHLWLLLFLKGQNDDDNTNCARVHARVCDEDDNNGDLLVRTFIVYRQFLPI